MNALGWSVLARRLHGSCWSSGAVVGGAVQSPMKAIVSRRDLLGEIDAEYARLSCLIDRVPPELWKSSRVNTAEWSLKDVLAHVADWAIRCNGWCDLGETPTGMTPPAPGFTWRETRELNHAIHLKHRRRALARVLHDFRTGHSALRARAATMGEADLLTVGRFGWCGSTWSVAKHIRANTAAHYRWARTHFNAALKAAGVDRRAEKTVTPPPARTARTTRRVTKTAH